MGLKQIRRFGFRFRTTAPLSSPFFGGWVLALFGALFGSCGAAFADDSIAKRVEAEIHLAHRRLIAGQPYTFPTDPQLLTLFQKQRLSDTEALQVAQGLEAVYPNFFQRPAAEPETEVLPQEGHEVRLQIAVRLLQSAIVMPSIELRLVDVFAKMLSLEPHDATRAHVILFMDSTGPDRLTEKVRERLKAISTADGLLMGVARFEKKRAEDSLAMFFPRKESTCSQRIIAPLFSSN